MIQPHFSTTALPMKTSANHYLPVSIEDIPPINGELLTFFVAKTVCRKRAVWSGLLASPAILAMPIGVVATCNGFSGAASSCAGMFASSADCVKVWMHDAYVHEYRRANADGNWGPPFKVPWCDFGSKRRPGSFHCPRSGKTGGMRSFKAHCPTTGTP